MSRLLAEIASGAYASREMLPREEDLRDRWQVSRGVVREVIRALEERGVVTVKHGRGATVNSPQDWNLLDPEVLLALLNGRSARSVLTELLECRKALELETARRAAERATDAQLAQLRAACDRLDSTPRRAAQDRGTAELTIHRLLAHAAGNRPIASMLEPVLDALDSKATALGRRAESSSEHRRILGAIERRDPPAAETAMRDHLDALAHTLTRPRSS